VQFEKFCRLQFPFVHAQSLTINKTQATTIDDYFLIDGSAHCFGHGTLYVGISRARLASQLAIYIPITTLEDDDLSGTQVDLRPSVGQKIDRDQIVNVVFKDLVKDVRVS
jgi:ethanolamine utilization protein EutP (predicted NTPase)